MESRRPMRRWLKRSLLYVGSVSGLLAGLVILAPTLLSSGIGRGFVERRLGSMVHGTASIRGLSLSWLGRQRVEGLQCRDASGQTLVEASTTVDNGLLDLLLGRVDVLRVEVEGSVRARLKPDGSVSVADLAGPQAPSASPAPAASGGSLELPFPVRLEVRRFDLQLDDDAGVAMAVRELKGSAELGRGRPLQVDVSASTQVRDQSGQVTLKARLDDVLSQAGKPELALMSGTVQASVSGFMLPAAGVPLEVRSASLSMRAEAGKPITVESRGDMLVDGKPASAEVSLQANRPASGVAVDAWASDPRTWTGSVSVRNLPTSVLQRWLAGTPFVATRDLGSSVDLAVQGAASEARIELVTDHVKLQASASVDATTGAVQGRDASITVDLDPALLAAAGLRVEAPGRVRMALSRFTTPAVGAAGMDVSAVSLEGSVAMSPMELQGLAAEPVQLAMAASFRSPALRDSVELTLDASVQRQPVQFAVQVTGLGAALDLPAAGVRGTLNAGPLDPGVLPGLPAQLRARLASAGLGASSLRASFAGTVSEGQAQFQADTQAGTLASKAAWDATSLQVPEFRAGLRLQPTLVNDLAGGRFSVTQPVPVQVAAGPARMARRGMSIDVESLTAVPLNLAVAAIDLGPVSGVCADASLRGLKAAGSLSPFVGPLFDGALSIESVSSTQVTSAGTVQVDGVSVQGKVHASVSQLFTGKVSVAEVAASAVEGVGPVRARAIVAEATVPVDPRSAGQVKGTVASVTCDRVPGLASTASLDSITLTMDGPLEPAEGTRVIVQAEARDGTAVLAGVRAELNQPQGTREIRLDLSEVDMRRALALVGSAQEMPDWVGAAGDRSLSARVRTGDGGMAFSVQASLDPITASAEGTRAADGTLSITKARGQARLPAEVVKRLLVTADPAIPLQSCATLQFAASVAACTLPGDGQGGVRVQDAVVDASLAIEPWSVQLVDTPPLSFGAAQVRISSRGGQNLEFQLRGSLAAGQGKPAPLELSLQAPQVRGPDGRGRPDLERLSVKAVMQDFPTSIVDRASGMDGYLLDMLGPVFTVDLSGRTGSGPEDFLEAGLRSPTLAVQAPRVRFSQGVLSVSPEAPVVASLQPDDRFRSRVLRPINPFFADLRTTEGRAIRATVQSLRMPVPVDMRSLDVSFTVEVGEVELEKSDQFLAIMDLATASQGRTVPGMVSPLVGSVAAGVLTYREFKVQVGRLGKSGWQQTLLSDARIDLGRSPAMAEPITIRYPASGVANLLAGLPGGRRLMGKLNDVLGSGGQKVGEMAQVAVDFTGPLDGSPLKQSVRAELDLPPGFGDRIIQDAGKALDKLFGGGK